MATHTAPALYELPRNRIRWTRQQCEAIRDSGVLPGRYELIDGEILSKMGQNPPHSVALVLLQEWLVAVYGIRHVRNQSNMDVGDVDPDHNEPEPDLVVTREAARAYSKRHPGPDDVLLVVEVADSTLAFDCTTKAALYAASGVPEYWVADLVGRRLIVHRVPGLTGYADVAIIGAGDRIASLAQPDASALVADLLPGD